MAYKPSPEQNFLRGQPDKQRKMITNSCTDDPPIRWIRRFKRAWGRKSNPDRHRGSNVHREMWHMEGAFSRARTQGQTEAELQKNQPKAREGANVQNEFTLAEQREQGTVEPTTQPTPTGVGGQPKKMPARGEVRRDAGAKGRNGPPRRKRQPPHFRRHLLRAQLRKQKRANLYLGSAEIQKNSFFRKAPAVDSEHPAPGNQSTNTR